MSKVAIIGFGNVGYHLANRLAKKNEITLFSKNPDGSVTLGLDKLISSEYDFIIISTPDEAIKDVSENIDPTDAIIMHTSGSRSIDDVSGHKKHGVMYPLQTFSKEKEIDFTRFPIFVEGNDEGERELFSFVRSFSNDVRLTTSVNRAKLHLAAVFACNFTNHMYHSAEKLLEPLDLTFQDLQHLVEETLAKALELNPSQVQTGPAKRGDESTIQLHLEMIKNDRMKKMYELITEDIRNQ